MHISYVKSLLLLLFQNAQEQVQAHVQSAYETSVFKINATKTQSPGPL